MAIVPVADPVDVAVFARAPRAGLVKSRLIPALGAAGAARLQRRLVLHGLAVAREAVGSRVTLWGTSEGGQRFFRALQRCCGVRVRTQPEGDLGARMASAFAVHAGALLLIGSDCPAVQAEHLRWAAAALGNEREGGYDAVFIPAEDGGYVLVGLRRPQPRLFEAIDWGSERVMRQTRRRLRELRLRWLELPPLWDVDRPADLARLAGIAGFSPWVRGYG